MFAGMSSHSPPTMALVMPVETRLWQLVGEIEAIAPEVSDAALREWQRSEDPENACMRSYG